MSETAGNITLATAVEIDCNTKEATEYFGTVEPTVPLEDKRRGRARSRGRPPSQIFLKSILQPYSVESASDEKKDEDDGFEVNRESASVTAMELNEKVEGLVKSMKEKNSVTLNAETPTWMKNLPKRKISVSGPLQTEVSGEIPWMREIRKKRAHKLSLKNDEGLLGFSDGLLVDEKSNKVSLTAKNTQIEEIKTMNHNRESNLKLQNVKSAIDRDLSETAKRISQTYSFASKEVSALPLNIEENAYESKFTNKITSTTIENGTYRMSTSSVSKENFLKKHADLSINTLISAQKSSRMVNTTTTSAVIQEINSVSPVPHQNSSKNTEFTTPRQSLQKDDSQKKTINGSINVNNQFDAKVQPSSNVPAKSDSTASSPPAEILTKQSTTVQNSDVNPKSIASIVKQTSSKHEEQTESQKQKLKDDIALEPASAVFQKTIPAQKISYNSEASEKIDNSSHLLKDAIKGTENDCMVKNEELINSADAGTTCQRKIEIRSPTTALLITKQENIIETSPKAKLDVLIVNKDKKTKTKEASSKLENLAKPTVDMDSTLKLLLNKIESFEAKYKGTSSEISRSIAKLGHSIEEQQRLLESFTKEIRNELDQVNIIS